MYVKRNTMPTVIVVVMILAMVLILIASPTLTRAQAPADTAIELVGPIESMTTDSIVVNGQTVQTSQAEIVGALQIGVLVRVEGTLQADGVIQARQIKQLDETRIRQGEVELIGLVTSFIGTNLVVNRVTIDVSNAEFSGRINPGDVVKVHASLVQERWVAREVERLRLTRGMLTILPKLESEFEVRGTLAEVGPGHIVVVGLRIDTTRAEIKSRLVVGALVKVHVRLVNGTPVAREIELADNDDLDQFDNENEVKTGIGGNGNANSNSNDNDDNGNSNSNDNDDDQGNSNDNGNDNDDDDDHGNDNGNDNDD